MTISSIFQDLREVGVKLTPMSVLLIHAKIRGTARTRSTVTGKKCWGHLSQERWFILGVITELKENMQQNKVTSQFAFLRHYFVISQQIA